MHPEARWHQPLFAEVNGGRVAYRMLGPRSGPPVVLLHGLASSAVTWQSFAAALATAGRWVIAPDLRGHGLSANRDSYAFDEFRLDVEALLAELDVGQADLVGHSLGGRFATMIAQCRPALVRRLVLEEMRPPIQEVTALSRVGLLAGSSRMARHLGLVSRLWTFDRSMARSVVQQFSKPAPEWWSALPAVTARTLVLHGGPRGYAPLDRLLRVAALIPDCRLTTVDAGHRIHSSRPDEFNAAVLPFLRD
ncbi:alpha/beta hydrolase [Amycolatopsis sp. FBCC-B4732]|uniref:alpha/beta fold hydrolase n=1 Tax=Amycolatopsis sp. FBCC-B4732 TaxID=3079339 RepID=UPI001FF0FD24|nr:alpha/beta hydrolase [Amycolatopsis sp. FBCC-B4732]UOX85604.1 alpha/beta hydrolase [Amycolatopsis sp. FBCC-B4732]